MTPLRPAGPRAPPGAQDEGLEPGAVRAQAGGGWGQMGALLQSHRYSHSPLLRILLWTFYGSPLQRNLPQTKCLKPELVSRVFCVSEIWEQLS